MKARFGFVSNSSSSSFVLDRREMTEKQIWQVLNVAEALKEMEGNRVADLLECREYIGDWRIYEEGDFIKGVTSMDNFDMEEFIDFIGAHYAIVAIGDGYIFDADDDEDIN